MNKFLRLGLCCASILLYGYVARAQTASLEINVTNIKSSKGSIRLGLFTTKEDFLKNAVERRVLKPEGKEITVIFENLPPGDYALSVIHDENDNDELDTNTVGIPKEGFAFGNNAFGSFGPPSFEKAKITITDQPVKQVIKLKYY